MEDIEDYNCGCVAKAGMDGKAMCRSGHGWQSYVQKRAWMAKLCVDAGMGGRFLKRMDDLADAAGGPMWYVMQVVPGREWHTVLLVERILSGEVLEKCTVPMRRMKKKYQGSWKEISEKLFPGYVFLASEKPQLLYDELKQIPVLTKLLGNCEEYFTPLSEADVQLLMKLQDLQNGQKGAAFTGLSKVSIGEDRQIRILSGPLKNLEGQIQKINLHKRIAVVEAEFMGNRSRIHLGIEITET